MDTQPQQPMQSPNLAPGQSISDKPKKKRKRFLLIPCIILILLIVFVLINYSVSTISIKSARSRARDTRRISDIRQIELALELHFAKYEQYPSKFQVLIDENFLNFIQAPIDLKTGKPYSYAYGTDKNNRKILYYHLGAVLNNKNSDMLNQDDDFFSIDTDLIDWQRDPDYISNCLLKINGMNGFNGADDSGCGTIYDKVYLSE